MGSSALEGPEPDREFSKSILILGLYITFKIDATMMYQPKPNWGRGTSAKAELTPKSLTLAVAGALLAPAMSLWAGDSSTLQPAPEEAVVAPEAQSWADAYRSIGKLYENEDNSLVQGVSLIGRLHYHYGYTDGTGAEEFDYDTDEIRRFRIGAKAKVLSLFELKGQAEIFDDRGPVGGQEGFEFKHFWDLYGKFDAGSAFRIDGLDVFKMGYGRRETHTSKEWDTSSNKLKTVERSAISNKVWPSDVGFSNPTGTWIELGKGNWSAETGVFTTTRDEYIAGWDDGQMYWANAWYDFKDVTGADVSELYLSGYYQDAELGEDRLAGGVEWSTSTALTYGRGRWRFQLEGIYGQNGDQSRESREGNFWGFVFLPSYWLIEDKLEAVGRYQYQGAENSEGIRLNSRYVRRAGSVEPATGLSNGRGDEHHSFYLGLKYHIIKDNIHILGGVEYDDIESGGAHVYDGWTTFLGFRIYF